MLVRKLWMREYPPDSLTSTLEYEGGDLQKLADQSGPEALWEIRHLIDPHNNL